MWIICELFCLVAFSIDVCTGNAESVNETSTSLNREILEKQARRAYENACFGLQELANWMSVVFKLKSVWTSSTIDQMDDNFKSALDRDQRKIPPLPQRPKSGLACSLQSVQVTLRTYAHLQGQLLQLKGIMGRNAMKTSSVTLGNVNATIRERIKVLDTFNETLNNVFSKLRQNTQDLSSAVGSENWRNLITKFREGRVLQNFRMPTNIFQTGIPKEEMGSNDHPRPQNKGFFQTVGRVLDNIIFPAGVSNSRPKVSNSEDVNFRDDILDVNTDVNFRDDRNNFIPQKVEDYSKVDNIKLMKEQDE